MHTPRSPRLDALLTAGAGLFLLFALYVLLTPRPR